ncbi:hypothetical protein KSX_61090 [Ktedonospora formicarum]|uniref:Uncharacterized protein n=1 Tax=Ktedonospora formicarum TaxID=2778364 RepID=A0A8J3I375_9CHLR|nr:hypothetical protein KSX_61090 [Ktedonospora formicarum]
MIVKRSIGDNTEDPSINIVNAIGVNRTSSVYSSRRKNVKNMSENEWVGGNRYYWGEYTKTKVCRSFSS